MVPLYHFSHERREIWEGGRPLLITARTDDNGEELDITLRPNGPATCGQSTAGRTGSIPRPKCSRCGTTRPSSRGPACSSR